MHKLNHTATHLQWLQVEMQLLVEEMGSRGRCSSRLTVERWCCLQLDLHILENGEPPQVGELWVNTRTGETGLKRLQPGRHGDFPRVRPSLIGDQGLVTASLPSRRSCCSLQGAIITIVHVPALVLGMQQKSLDV